MIHSQHQPPSQRCFFNYDADLFKKFGSSIKPQTTTNGHYIVPVGRNNTLFSSFVVIFVNNLPNFHYMRNQSKLQILIMFILTSLYKICVH